MYIYTHTHTNIIYMFIIYEFGYYIHIKYVYLCTYFLLRRASGRLMSEQIPCFSSLTQHEWRIVTQLVQTFYSHLRTAHSKDKSKKN